MDVSDDARFQFLMRSRMHDDELAIALKGHLVTEYLLNRIINEKLSDHKKKREATYSQKLDHMKTNSLLPPEALMSLHLLNSFRNRFAHQLDTSIEEQEMVFYKDGGERVRIRHRKGRYPERHYLRLLTHGVLTQLINHMLLELKVDPRWRSGKNLENLGGISYIVIKGCNGS
jgi:uncharacterized protein YutE (UPF0331/DUF86 family)